MVQQIQRDETKNVEDEKDQVVNFNLIQSIENGMSGQCFMEKVMNLGEEQKDQCLRTMLTIIRKQKLRQSQQIMKTPRITPTSSLHVLSPSPLSLINSPMLFQSNINNDAEEKKPKTETNHKNKNRKQNKNRKKNNNKKKKMKNERRSQSAPIINNNANNIITKSIKQRKEEQKKTININTYIGFRLWRKIKS